MEGRIVVRESGDTQHTDQAPFYSPINPTAVSPQSWPIRQIGHLHIKQSLERETASQQSSSPGPQEHTMPVRPYRCSPGGSAWVHAV